MILSYNGNPHAENEANVSITREGLEADDGFVYGYTERWDITGILHGDTDSVLVTAMNNLLAVYSVQGGDLEWTKNGTTMHSLISGNTLTGTRVTAPPHFTKNSGGELTTFRTYAIRVEAEVAFAELSLVTPLILKFEESFNTTGTGGPKVGFLPTLTGKPQKQQLQQYTSVTLVQSGLSVGLGAYPAVNTPLWPDDEHVDRRQINKSPNRKRNGVGLEYPIQWNYTFERNEAFPSA